MDTTKLTTIKSYLFSSKGMESCRQLLSLILIVLLARTGASFTWKAASIVSSPQESALLPLATGKNLPPSAVPRNVRTGAPAQEINLFGKAGKMEISPVALTPEAAPETTLNLILKGVIAAEPMSRALAVITEKGKQKTEKLYGLGEQVAGNAVIREIFADRVILRRGGVLETLMLQGEKGNVNSASRKSVGIDRIISQGDGIHWQINNLYWQQQLSDIPTLAKEVGVEIYKEGDAQKGYRLISSRGSNLLRELGLQPGDVIHEINGVPLNSVHDGLAAYQQLRNTSEVKVVISRDNRREIRIYQIGSGG